MHCHQFYILMHVHVHTHCTCWEVLLQILQCSVTTVIQYPNLVQSMCHQFP